jgi:hypothetical protein
MSSNVNPPQEPQSRAWAEPPADVAEIEITPDPLGPPQPVRDRDWLKPIDVVFLAAAMSFLDFLVILAWPHRTMGVPASTRLEWERRQKLMDQVVLEIKDDLPAEANDEQPKSE